APPNASLFPDSSLFRSRNFQSCGWGSGICRIGWAKRPCLLGPFQVGESYRNIGIPSFNLCLHKPFSENIALPSCRGAVTFFPKKSEEHTSELQSREKFV